MAKRRRRRKRRRKAIAENMLKEIGNITILPTKFKQERSVQENKYTRSDALRNIYKAKVNTITKKRGK
jgi:hypothetical protein